MNTYFYQLLKLLTNINPAPFDHGFTRSLDTYLGATVLNMTV